MTDYGISDQEAQAILADQAHRVRTVWRALDLDGDDVLSADEIDRASTSLLALDGPRTSAIVRILDPDGDCVITADDIADTPARIRQLDQSGRGHLLPDDDLAPRNPIRQARFDGPAGFVSHQDILRSFDDEDTGPLMPGADPRQDDSYLLVYEHSNAADAQFANNSS